MINIGKKQRIWKQFENNTKNPRFLRILWDNLGISNKFVFK